MTTKKKTKDSCGYAEVPRACRRMLLVRYDLYPFMLVHKAHRLPDGSYRWVSSWEAGHQNLGLWSVDCDGILAVLPVEEGERLSCELESIRNQHYEATKELDRKFIGYRDNILARYHVSDRPRAKKTGGKDAKEGA